MKKQTHKKGISYTGQILSPGLAEGPLYHREHIKIDFPIYWISESQIIEQKKRFHKSLATLYRELQQLQNRLCLIQDSEQRHILEALSSLLKDSLFIENVENAIQTDFMNVEWAVNHTLDEFIRTFSTVEHDYFKDRKHDFDFIKQAVISTLQGKQSNWRDPIPPGSIVAIKELSPPLVVNMARQRVAGFITEIGGPHTHATILARAQRIPVILLSHGDIESLPENAFIELDGERGRLLVNPDQRARQDYKKRKNERNLIDTRLKKEANKLVTTADGQAAQLLANVEFENEISHLSEYGADGIGLFRTEFLFMDRTSPPTIEEQVKVYKKILQKTDGKEVTIRTMDLGADKLPFSSINADEENPALGLRGLRLSLKMESLFKEQLSALYRVSTFGKLRISLPMVTTLQEVRTVKKLIGQVTDQLKKEKHSFNAETPLGIMIETPGALLEMDLLAREVDFFSVGTNDLVQYILAVDRNNELLASLYNPLTPSILRALKTIVEIATFEKKPLTLCGEIAANPLYMILLIGLGFRSFSMNPLSIPLAKKIISLLDSKKMASLSEKLLSSQTIAQSEALLKKNYPQELLETMPFLNSN